MGRNMKGRISLPKRSRVVLAYWTCGPSLCVSSLARFRDGRHDRQCWWRRRLFWFPCSKTARMDIKPHDSDFEAFWEHYVRWAMIATPCRDWKALSDTCADVCWATNCRSFLLKSQQWWLLIGQVRVSLDTSPTFMDDYEQNTFSFCSGRYLVLFAPQRRTDLVSQQSECALRSSKSHTSELWKTRFSGAIFFLQRISRTNFVANTCDMWWIVTEYLPDWTGRNLRWDIHLRIHTTNSIDWSFVLLVITIVDYNRSRNT